MEMARDEAGLGPIVTGFSGRGFRVRDAVFPDGLLLSPTAARRWDAAPASADALTMDMLDGLFDGDPAPEFLLLGSGSGLVRPTPAFTRALEARGMGVEVMDSRAAARAWGVLRGEQRWIVAALMPL